MSTKLIAAILVVAASGCRMCSDSCDYSPPVAGSPYNAFTARAGSAFTGEPVVTSEPPAQRPLSEMAPPLSPTPLTPTP
jgi:hypothetical protein